MTVFQYVLQAIGACALGAFGGWAIGQVAKFGVKVFRHINKKLNDDSEEE